MVNISRDALAGDQAQYGSAPISDYSVADSGLGGELILLSHWSILSNTLLSLVNIQDTRRRGEQPGEAGDWGGRGAGRQGLLRF